MVKFKARLAYGNNERCLLTDIRYANSGDLFRDHCWVESKPFQRVSFGSNVEFVANEQRRNAHALPRKHKRLKKDLIKIKHVKGE